MGYIIAVDSGGTFSDCVVLEEGGRVVTAKAPSTPADFSRGVLDSVAAAAEVLGLDARELLSQADIFGHGTTVATNALLTRSGARVGLVTTKGHEDAILIGRVKQKVAGLTEDEIIYSVKLDKPQPIVPRPMIRGVTERVDYKGAEIVPLDLEEAEAAVEALVARSAQAIAVCFLWSFLNPAHEERVVEMVRRRWPDLVVMASSRVAPLVGEYERTVTTVFNCYLTGVISDYLAGLERRLQESGFHRSPLIMQSSGGVASVEVARRAAVRLLSSGPAGGVIAARQLGQLLGYQDLITTDVGGTSFDVGLVVGGEPHFSQTSIYGQYEVLNPAIEIESIGAGGGSIAWVEAATGLLKVGPQSAGADPGPVCYGRGGTEPTVTDANLVLNRIDPDYFLGGRIKLDRAAAEQAIREKVAGRLGLSVEEAAIGIIDILDNQMSDLVRRATIGRGYDPRTFVLFAFGGAGPLHVGAYARGTGVRFAVAPAQASVFSALGIAGSNVVTIQDASYPMVYPFDAERLNEIYRELEQQARQALTGHGIAADHQSLRRYIALRYGGQVHELPTPVPEGRLSAEVVERVVEDFERRYEQKYGPGTAYKPAGIEARTYQVRGTGLIPTPELVKLRRDGTDPRVARKATRPVYFRDFDGFHPTPIYERERLSPGHRVEGPAVVEAPDTTMVVHPGQVLEVDDYRNLILHLGR